MDADQRAYVDRLMKEGQTTFALQKVLHNFRTRKIVTASNWILAGTGAFIFSIIIDPKKFFQNYGIWHTKISALLF